MFNWLIQQFLGNTPLWLWPFVAGAGFGAYIITGILAHFPQIKPYAVLAKVISLITMVVGIFMYGGAGVTAIYQAELLDLQHRVEVAEQKSSDANELLAQKRGQNTKIIHDTKVVIREHIVKDAVQIDSTCKVDPVAIQDLNEAAVNPITKRTK